MPSTAPTYILTGELEPDSFAWLDGLRRQHFPVDRNLLPAHLTFLHRLSSAQTGRLDGFDLPSSPVPILFNAPVLLGSGVAMRIQSPEAEGLRTAARHATGDEFSRQDSQPWRPHVTIQNKVPAQEAHRLHQALREDFAPRAGAVTGLLVWEYLGGPWRLEKRLPFA